MKKILYILIFLNVSLYAQVHSWVQLYNPSASVPGTNFIALGDSVYYVDASNGGTYSAQFIKMYKGLTSAQILEPYNINNGFIGTSYLQSCAEWQNGNLFNYNNVLYNFGFSSIGNCGFFQRARVTMTSYIPSTVSNDYLSNSEYDIYGVSGSSAVINDSIYIFLYNYGNGDYNKVMVRSIATNAYNTRKISAFNDVRFNNWYRYVAGSFVIADTVYALTSYKNNYTTESSSGSGSAVFSDTVATLWKQNPITYSWDSVKSFNRAGFVLDIKKNNKVYFLLSGLDSSQNDCGLWEFDGNNLQKAPKPPSSYRVVGFEVDSGGNIWESVANSLNADSNKIYFYSGVWDNGQVVYSTSESKNIFINNILFNKPTLFIGSKLSLTPMGVGAFLTAAYDTNYYYLTIQKPITGYYQDSASVPVTWTSDNINDSIQIWVSYDSLQTFDSVKTVYGIDSTTIKLDSVSNNCFIKIIRPSKSISSISQKLIVYAQKFLTIDTVFFTSKANIKLEHNGIDSIQSYYSADNIIWQSLGKSIIDSTFKIDTISYAIIFPMNSANSYYKVVELKDTAIYKFSMSKISSFGLIPNPQTCLSFAFNDIGGMPGGNDIKDLGCGWVNTITKYYGTVSTTVNSDGTVTTIQNETAYLFPYTGMPVLSSNDIFQPISSFSPFIYAGRSYWITTTQTQWYPSYDLWMKDLVNNITYKVMHIGNVGAGITAYWGNAEAKSYPNNIGIFRSSDGLNAFSTKLLPYPVSPIAPLISNIYHLQVINGQTYHDYYDIFTVLRPRL